MVITQEDAVCMCFQLKGGSPLVIPTVSGPLPTYQIPAYEERHTCDVDTSVWLLTRNSATTCCVIVHCSNLAIGPLGVQYSQHQLRHNICPVTNLHMCHLIEIFPCEWSHCLPREGGGEEHSLRKYFSLAD